MLSIGCNDSHSPCIFFLVAIEFLALGLKKERIVGTIPSEISNCRNLEALTLQFGNLQGTLSTTLGLLANLKWLDVSGNALSGQVPTELGNLLGLERLSLHINNFEGPVPTELGNLQQLGKKAVLGVWLCRFLASLMYIPQFICLPPRIALLG